MTEEVCVRPSEIIRRAIGPLDKRKNTTRCQPCANRRVKCDGGHPCKRCVRTNKTCAPQQLEQTRVKFVHVSGHVLSSTIPMQVRKHDDTIYLDHFASFIQQCHFTKDFAAVNADIVTIIGKYPLLFHIAIAIGALDASRKGSIRSFGELESPQQIAFRACGRSIQDLYSAISTANSVFRDDVFWSTFLHGLFELMAENSGNSFANHMVFGASKMLLQLEPTNPLSSPTKSLIDAFWILETNRAILYGDNTTLLLDGWQLFDKIESVPQKLRSSDPTLDALALDGLEIKERLLNWQEGSHLERLPVDSFTQLAVIVHHALLLYHCSNFTFYSCWMTREIPQLNQSEVDKHVGTILDLSQSLLSDTCIPAVLLLFPLRMAGIHVFESHIQEKVLGTIRRIRQKGFIVSDRIEVDLQEFWHYTLRETDRSK
ncbi:Fungal transcriptional regulatory protein, N-terminal [Penicillium camemberti]|uniref:Fungal transcriptional regulatory protein, N-terminal n=1 Tax=Penicillium camemberti (strain FM 013) TaxID=1429867 RepID=A0A0G4PG01_PENC3|nr:Fungal transcriptional regulatory protein, N-terminal [Penicillium camemberti]